MRALGKKGQLQNKTKLTQEPLCWRGNNKFSRKHSAVIHYEVCLTTGP
jgi:hypothetical protein